MAPVYKCKSQRGNLRNVSSKAAWIGFRVEHIVGEGWPMLSVGSGGCLTTAQVGRANNEFNWTKATATTPIGGQLCSSTNLTPNFFATKLLGYFGHIPPAITLSVISETILNIPIHFQESNKVQVKSSQFGWFDASLMLNISVVSPTPNFRVRVSSNRYFVSSSMSLPQPSPTSGALVRP